MLSRTLTTKEKALSLNLDEKIYGTLAEIGGGQEVAAHFFKAGGASGTIAKTMSAYDMTFSDAIYGHTERYVCEEKLLLMLNKEYNLLSKRLGFRAKRTSFFAFANTVETINFQKTNKGHGWLGLRYQLHPNSQPNSCVIHVRLKDNDSIWQQQALGDLGVNLIYGCYHFSDPEELINSLVDGIGSDRVEIDMFRLEGPDYHHVDNRLMSLKLVKNGLTEAAMFNQNGEVLQPSAAIYKKNVLVLRGRFRPVTYVNVDMMISGMRAFRDDPEVDQERLLVLSELTLNDLRNDGEIDETDFMDRVDLLCSLGQTVLISNHQEHYLLASYLAQFTRKKKIGIILGINNLALIFEEKYYENLNGGILESFGRLFGSNVKLLVYPSANDDDTLRTCENFSPAEHLVYLFKHLYVNQNIA
ncbi:MAG: TonB-dependent receptor, partial [Bacteroidota bacterium]